MVLVFIHVLTSNILTFSSLLSRGATAEKVRGNCSVSLDVLKMFHHRGKVVYLLFNSDI